MRHLSYHLQRLNANRRMFIVMAAMLLVGFTAASLVMGQPAYASGQTAKPQQRITPLATVPTKPHRIAPLATQPPATVPPTTAYTTAPYTTASEPGKQIPAYSTPPATQVPRGTVMDDFIHLDHHCPYGLAAGFWKNTEKLSMDDLGSGPLVSFGLSVFDQDGYVILVAARPSSKAADLMAKAAKAAEKSLCAKK